MTRLRRELAIPERTPITPAPPSLKLRRAGLSRTRPPKLVRAKEEGEGAGYFFFPEILSFLIKPAARLASVSDSKPTTAEYFFPTPCATRNARLIPASA